MKTDAIRLFEEDRQRFLTLYREFLQNPRIPDHVKAEAIAVTPDVLRQIGELVGPAHG